MQSGVDHVKHWLISRVAEILDIPLDQLQRVKRMDELGLDSVTQASLVLEIEKQFGCVINQEALFDYPTVQALAEHIVSNRCEEHSS
jgi:acyl carrier protein